MAPKRKTVEEARAELHSLNSVLSAIDHNIKGTVREHCSANKKQKGVGQYLPVLRSLWLHGSADHSEVQLFLKKHFPIATPAQIEDWCNSLHNWASTVNSEERELHLDPGLDTAMAHHVKNALRFLEEAIVFKWVENLNLAKGMTPSGSCIHKFRCQNRGPFGVKYLGSPSTLKRRSINQWLQRWRARWDITRGTVPCRELVSNTEACMKARP